MKVPIVLFEIIFKQGIKNDLLYLHPTHRYGIRNCAKHDYDLGNKSLG